MAVLLKSYTELYEGSKSYLIDWRNPIYNVATVSDVVIKAHSIIFQKTSIFQAKKKVLRIKQDIKSCTGLCYVKSSFKFLLPIPFNFGRVIDPVLCTWSYLLRQWAAVTPHLSFNKLAPQKGALVLLLKSNICQGIEPGAALAPPIILARGGNFGLPQAGNDTRKR